MFKECGGVVFYVRDFGGPGSGNFGHAGRPGERGGSASGGGGNISNSAKSAWDGYNRIQSEKSKIIRDGVSKEFAKKADSLTVEHGIVIGPDNKSFTLIGNEHSISIPTDTNVKDSHIIHNHPGEHFPGLSPADVKMAIGRDVSSITATGKAGIITIDRPSTGWPILSSDDIDNAYKPEFSRVRNIIETSKEYKREVSTIELSKELRDSTKTALSSLGLEVKYVSRF